MCELERYDIGRILLRVKMEILCWPLCLALVHNNWSNTTRTMTLIPNEQYPQVYLITWDIYVSLAICVDFFRGFKEIKNSLKAVTSISYKRKHTEMGPNYNGGCANCLPEDAIPNIMMYKEFDEIVALD